MSRAICLIFIFTFTMTAQAFSLDAFSERICPVVRKYNGRLKWSKSLTNAVVRARSFHDTSENGAIDFSAMKNFIARKRDGFALAFISKDAGKDSGDSFARLIEIYHTADKTTDLRSLTLTPVRNASLSTPFFETALYNKNYPELQAARENAARLSETLIKFILSQPENSLTPMDLLGVATELYNGDILSAYGLIGFVFFEEAKASDVRPFHQPLAAKMKSLFNESSAEKVGVNYHFWVYLSQGLLGEPWIGRWSSFFLERVRQDDPLQQQADLAGIDAGLAIRDCLK